MIDPDGDIGVYRGADRAPVYDTPAVVDEERRRRAFPSARVARPLLAAVLILALAGCGGDESTAPGGDPGSPDAATDQEEVADSDGTTEEQGTDSDRDRENSEPAPGCWGEGDRQICPEPPRGTSPEDCADGVLVATEYFQGNTGICLPFDPDDPEGALHRPSAPSAPRFMDWDCPEGWMSVPPFRNEHGNTAEPPVGMAAFHICDVPSLPEGCPPGTFAIPGDTACRPLGVECPAAGELWHSEELIRSRAPGYDGPIFYVSPTGSPTGAGTRADPMAEIQGALAALGADGIVALARGTYPQTPTVSSRAALVGACAAETMLVAMEPSAHDHGVITLLPSAEAVLSDIGVTGTRRGIVVVNPTHRNEIRSVAVVEATVLGISVWSGQGSLEVRDTRIARTRPDAEGLYGRALEVFGGAEVVVERGLFDDNREAAVLAAGAETRLELWDLEIRGTRGQDADGLFGAALLIMDGARVRVERGVFDDNREAAVWAGDQGTRVELRDIVVRGTREQEADGMFGRALNVEAGAEAVVERALLDDNREVAVLAANEGTRIEFRDLAVRGTREREIDGVGGIALEIQAGAEAAVERGLLADNRNAAVWAAHEGTRIEFRDLLIRGTREQEADGASGEGIFIHEGATAWVVRGLLEDNRNAAVWAAHEGTRIEFRDLVVRGTREAANDGRHGQALALGEGAIAVVERALLQDNRGSAVWARHGGTRLDLRDVVVRGTREVRGSAVTGQALDVEMGAEAVVERALLEDNRGAGVTAMAAGTRITLRDIVVRGTRELEASGTFGRGMSIIAAAEAWVERGLFEDNRETGVSADLWGALVVLRDVVVQDTAGHAADGQFGIGAGAYFGATLVLENTVVARSAMVGLQVAYDAIIEGDGIALVENAIGINIQVDDFDLSSQLRNLVFRYNAEDVMYLHLPVPDSSGLLGDLPER